MFKNSPIPIWVNILLIFLLRPMIATVYWCYFNHPFLLDAGIAIEGVPERG